MSSKEELIAKIVETEWNMFQNVQNIGGRSLCQEDPKTFEIMRTSQFMNWPEGALESYLSDLEEAKKNGRNLLTEKYARMMKSTLPLEYARIEKLLPPLNPEIPPLIDKIVEIVLEWEEELLREFPYVTARGRPIRRSADSPFVTSIETYLRGELETYSQRTLELYYKNLLNQKSENINGSKVVLEHTARRYGYKSLEEANEKLKGV
jgi:hypothetical protein